LPFGAAELIGFSVRTLLGFLIGCRRKKDRARRIVVALQSPRT
jgi:hypothetical protein